MKIIRFISHRFPTVPRLGGIQGSRIIDLATAYKVYLSQTNRCTDQAGFRIAEILLPSDTVTFLENGQCGLDAAKEAMLFAEQCGNTFNDDQICHEWEEVCLLPPIQRPRGLRDFYCFEQHLINTRTRIGREIPKLWYEIPSYYKGNTSTIVGPDMEVEMPEESEQLDYELEFACVIGKSGRNIKRGEAEEYIFGYTIMNDFSARDIQFREMQMNLGPGKGKDFGTALGPCLVTKDEFSDPYSLKMTAIVNGEVWSEGNTNTMYRKFTELIEYASKGEKIAAGDVFGSGTVGYGCGLELGKFLQDGDVVELEIEGIGILRNTIRKSGVATKVSKLKELKLL